MARYPSTALKDLADEELANAVARTPVDYYVIWNGRACPIQLGSVRSRTLELIEVAWEPASLRMLVRRAARLSGRLGLDPDRVRNAVLAHQRAGCSSYFLVRRTLAGDYVAVVDVPFPSTGSGPLRAGDRVLGRAGERFDDAESARSLVLQRA